MAPQRKLFGTFQGVFVPSVLTIFGVIMYLRLGWVAGQAGLLGTIVIVTLGTSITFLTALSISSIATNMRVGAGGAYYMISRSFGLEAGAAVGLPLFFAQALGISFYVTGFAESVHGFFPELPTQTIAIASVIGLGVVAYFSASAALKTQLLILAIILVSLVSFFLGAAPAESLARPPTAALPDVSFWAVFAVFFPAVTGIEAGVAMSGDLKNPSKSLPIGTLGAVLAGYIVYLLIPILLLSKVPQEVLKYDTTIIQKFARWEAAVVAGIWGATLSSALGALMGAPRTLQAMARDRLVPQFLGKGFGVSDEPRLATLLAIGIAIVGIRMGDLNVIAPVLSMFFLTSYAFINLATSVEGLVGSPTWRPSFRTPPWISLTGTAACVCAMLMIDAGATLMAGVLTYAVYWLTKKRGLAHRWADLRRGVLYMLARSAIYRLDRFDAEAAKTWRPNLLVMTGSPTHRWYLIDLARSLTLGKGFLAISTIVPKAGLTAERLSSIEGTIRRFLAGKNVPALVEVSASDDPPAAARHLVENFGLGPIYPNTILLGTSAEAGLPDLTDLIFTAQQARRNVLVLRDLEPADPEARPRRHRGIIRVWWNRDFKQNANLMLAIAHLLHGTPAWRRCDLRLCSLVRSEPEQAGALEFLEEFLGKARVSAEPEVFVKPAERGWYESVGELSADSELSLVGIKPLQEGGNEADLREHCRELFSSAKTLKRVLFVSAAQDLDFQKIFD
ncbi:MAG: amino acid permease [Bacteriovoracia bacterium]